MRLGRLIGTAIVVGIGTQMGASRPGDDDRTPNPDSPGRDLLFRIHSTTHPPFQFDSASPPSGDASMSESPPPEATPVPLPPALWLAAAGLTAAGWACRRGRRIAR